jgi:hypothetical protein
MSQTAERDFSIGPLFGMAIEYISLTFALELDREWITGQPECAGLNRHVVGDARALQERK